ncbi:MAG: RNA:NAD 2'-phosphotransferase (TPT1/KptA family), partial [Akkermansiaceae bacterium]
VSHDFKLYRTENGDWLTDEVPPDYLNRQFKI